MDTRVKREYDGGDGRVCKVILFCPPTPTLPHEGGREVVG
ncbi:hypothetical protein MNBD_ALPHA12-1121 [hydrothermal vent metagenome]|uniref:Uncharacterized protein n=1 Tax=hydrothermal vent metagenome TaxID=652676 RepID=A0A3B0TW23_9ZZZZ